MASSGCRSVRSLRSARYNEIRGSTCAYQGVQLRRRRVGQEPLRRPSCFQSSSLATSTIRCAAPSRSPDPACAVIGNALADAAWSGFAGRLAQIEAGLTEAAIEWWGKAGQRSLERSALVAATQHFTRALAQIATLPMSCVANRSSFRSRCYTHSAMLKALSRRKLKQP